MRGSVGFVDMGGGGGKRERSGGGGGGGGGRREKSGVATTGVGDGGVDSGDREGSREVVGKYVGFVFFLGS